MYYLTSESQSTEFTNTSKVFSLKGETFSPANPRNSPHFKEVFLSKSIFYGFEVEYPVMVSSFPTHPKWFVRKIV